MSMHEIFTLSLRAFPTRAKKPAEAEKLIASLVQSLRANAGKSPRCALFLSCLGLSMPIIPEAGESW